MASDHGTASNHKQWLTICFWHSYQQWHEKLSNQGRGRHIHLVAEEISSRTSCTGDCQWMVRLNESSISTKFMSYSNGEPLMIFWNHVNLHHNLSIVPMPTLLRRQCSSPFPVFIEKLIRLAQIMDTVDWSNIVSIRRSWSDQTVQLSPQMSALHEVELHDAELYQVESITIRESLCSSFWRW